METNTQSEATLESVNSVPVATAEESQATESKEGQQTENKEHDAPHVPNDPNHVHHHPHNSALYAATESHSAIDRVLPHHRPLDL